LFTIFLPIFSPIFFPADTVYHSLVKSYFMMWIAMAMRPLGGLFFGYFGDKFSRRKALVCSIWGIVVATLVIGLLPSVASVGAWATGGIVFAKAVQVFCFGGEYNGAGIFIVEHAQGKKEALAGSIFVAIAFIGALLACVAGILLTGKGMPKESWRIAFIAGGLIGLMGIPNRSNLPESPAFKPGDAKQHGMMQMLRLYPLELLTGVFVGAFTAIPFISILMFINPVLMAKGYFTNQQLMLTQGLMITVAIASLIPAGFMADKISPKKFMKLCCLALIIFSYPLLKAVDSRNLFSMLVALSALTVITEFFHGPSHAYSKNLFAMRYRYRASSLGFGFGVSVLGSITPIVGVETNSALVLSG
jgi:MHS family proline/betaine transporter-like MFS transporter